MTELYLSAGICFAGMLSGAFGVAFPLIAGPLFLLLYKPSDALLLTALCTLLSNLSSAVLLRHSIKYQLRWQLITPVLIGIPLGTAYGAPDRFWRTTRDHVGCLPAIPQSDYNWRALAYRLDRRNTRRRFGRNVCRARRFDSYLAVHERT